MTLSCNDIRRLSSPSSIGSGPRTPVGSIFSDSGGRMASVAPAVSTDRHGRQDGGSGFAASAARRYPSRPAQFFPEVSCRCGSGFGRSGGLQTRRAGSVPWVFKGRWGWAAMKPPGSCSTSFAGSWSGRVGSSCRVWSRWMRQWSGAGGRGSFAVATEAPSSTRR